MFRLRRSRPGEEGTKSRHEPKEFPHKILLGALPAKTGENHRHATIVLACTYTLMAMKLDFGSCPRKAITCALANLCTYPEFPVKVPA